MDLLAMWYQEFEFPELFIFQIQYQIPYSVIKPDLYV